MAADRGSEEEAVTRSGVQSASQLSLVNERQIIPGVLTGRDVEDSPDRSASSEGLSTGREAHLVHSPIQSQVC